MLLKILQCPDSPRDNELSNQNVNNIEVLALTEANFQLGISRYRSFALLQG